ncbi:Mo25-like protein [Sistotremastrum niveocremeum HHB9708]|uniref:Mo25-like protein n=2 Tax=Sistotremastraceae TaxID=3402574 RepID=A0A164R2Q4_9AGAM|nr:Mo25-like protein [Sistotremastrum niveocremeum HHB9708]KZT35266.1 Mo25-like protein [Sistotremastrum suecicum HHB10207 ss-3]
MNFFKAKQRTPAELVRGLRDAIPRLEAGQPGSETRRKANEEVTRNLGQIKAILYGDGDPLPELVAQLAQETYNTDLLHSLVLNIHKFDFEARKDVSQIFNNLLRRQIGSRWPTVEYLTAKHDILFATLGGYDNEDVALNTGMILKEMLRHESLCKILLYSDKFYSFPHYIEDTTFGISCDAFANFKETLTRHKPMVAEYLEKNYDRFFMAYAQLLASSNYVTKRQSLKLLGEILLDRANFNVMTRYISYEANLKMMMNLLRDKSKNIQFEAFHVFKVFVANPNKPPQVVAILRRNQAKLLAFLKDFHNDKEDEQFTDEKQFLIAQIQAL